MSIDREGGELVTNEDGGKKFDGGKLRFDLIDPEAERAWASVLTSGAAKYGDENWKSVEKFRYVGAIKRHLNKFQLGELVDVDSGEHPLAHVIACCQFLMYFDRERTVKDDGSNITLRQFALNDIDFDQMR